MESKGRFEHDPGSREWTVDPTVPGGPDHSAEADEDDGHVAVAALPPIPGTPIDPPVKAPPEAILEFDGEDNAVSTAVGVGYRAVTRFNGARAALLAAGTTYYTFLAMFSLIALGYGISAIFGADRIASYLTTALSEAFPGLLGEESIDPNDLKVIGQTATIVGLVVMLYAGSGAMVATSSSIHLIYGAPKDPRNYLPKRFRLLGILLIIGPLIALSFVASIAVVRFSDQILDAIGIEGFGQGVLIDTVAIAVTLAIDILVVFLLLSRLGGIRPPRRALLIGSITGAVFIQLLRIPMALILGFSVDKPQYGALAAPIGIMLVLYLNSITVFGAAAFTAGIAERDVPLEDLVALFDIADAQPDLES